MERNNRKRKVAFLDLYDDIYDDFNVNFNKLTITRKRKYDNINEEFIQKIKFIKIYSCSLHDNDKEICNIYNCNGINNLNFSVNNIDYIN
jgi:hypothetical protein